MNRLEDKADQPKPTIPRLAYTVPESATSIGCSEVTIYRLIARKKLRAVGCLRHKLIPAEELRRFLSEEAV